MQVALDETLERLVAVRTRPLLTHAMRGIVLALLPAVTRWCRR
jgi:hypothetical protein